MAIRVIIFDFDGTIADTRDTFVEIVNRLSVEFGYKPVEQEDLERLKNLSSQEIVRQARIPLVKIPFLLRRVKEELNREIENLKPFSGLKSSLLILKDKGYILGIVTSNLKENVEAFLNKNDLDSLFDFIDSGTPLFGKHKIIDKIIKQNHFRRDELMYVGDETRDINAAKKSHIKIVAVSWGFNSPNILAKYQPNFLIDRPQELLEILDDCELVSR